MADTDPNDRDQAANTLGRRDFLGRLGLLTAAPWLARAVAVPAVPESPPAPAPAVVPLGAHGVALLRGDDRAAAVPRLLAMLGFDPGWLRGKQVVVKANFNSAD